jgi:hypothetical protein
MPDRPEELIIAAVALTVFGGLLLLLVLVVRDTVRQRGRWGLNFKGLAGTDCPRCGASLPPAQFPKTFRQALWGGWTCDDCGCEIDKWGREIGRDDEPDDDHERDPRRARR